MCKSGSWVGLGHRTEVREKPLDVSRLGGTSAGCLVCKLNNQTFKTKNKLPTLQLCAVVCSHYNKTKPCQTKVSKVSQFLYLQKMMVAAKSGCARVEEAELAAWERAAEQLADEEHARRGTIVSSAAATIEERVENEVDTDGYAVYDEKSFLGWRRADQS